MTITRPEGDIKYVVAHGHLGTEVMFDHLVVGPTTATTTNPDGSFELVGLPPGTFDLQVITAPNYTAVNPIGGGFLCQSRRQHLFEQPVFRLPVRRQSVAQRARAAERERPGRRYGFRRTADHQLSEPVSTNPRSSPAKRSPITTWTSTTATPARPSMLCK